MPNLIGKPAAEAKRLLNLAGLNLGKETYEDNDSLKYQCIKRMVPGLSSGLVELGTYIDVTYHSSKTMDFKKDMKVLLHEDSVTNVPKYFEIDTVTESVETTDYENEEEEEF